MTSWLENANRTSSSLPSAKMNWPQERTTVRLSKMISSARQVSSDAPVAQGRLLPADAAFMRALLAGRELRFELFRDR